MVCYYRAGLASRGSCPLHTLFKPIDDQYCRICNVKHGWLAGRPREGRKKRRIDVSSLPTWQSKFVTNIIFVERMSIVCLHFGMKSLMNK